jgi:hypothetical protein
MTKDNGDMSKKNTGLQSLLNELVHEMGLLDMVSCGDIIVNGHSVLYIDGTRGTGKTGSYRSGTGPYRAHFYGINGSNTCLARLFDNPETAKSVAKLCSDLAIKLNLVVEPRKSKDEAKEYAAELAQTKGVRVFTIASHDQEVATEAESEPEEAGAEALAESHDSTDNQYSTSAKRGPRDRRFPCAVIIKSKIVYEAIVAKDANEAKKLFEAKYGSSPTICDNGEKYEGGDGYYVAKGTAMNELRVSITIPARCYRPSGCNFTGTFKGWNVIASGISSFDLDGKKYNRDELMSVVCVSQSNPKVKIDKPKIKKLELVRRDSIENLQKI